MRFIMSLIDSIRRLLGNFDPSTYEAPEGIPSPDEPRELVLYKFDTCPFCIRVMRVLDQTGIEVEYRDTHGDPEARAYLIERTGRTTVPCLFIDDVPFHESQDISAWLYAYHDRGNA